MGWSHRQGTILAFIFFFSLPFVPPNVAGADASISVGMSVDKSRTQPEDLLHYRIYLNNTGDAAAYEVWVNDTLPAEVDFIADTAAYLGGVRTGNYNWTFFDLPPGNHSFDITTKVQKTVPPGTSILNQVNLEYLNATGIKQNGSSFQVSSTTVLRSKTLFLHETGSSDGADARRPTNNYDCNADPPSPPAPIGDGCDYDQDGLRGRSIKKGGFAVGDSRTYNDWTLSPSFAGDFGVRGNLSVSLWLDDRGKGDPGAVQVDLYRNTTADHLMTLYLSFTPDSVLGFQRFYLNASGVSVDFGRGSTLIARVTVPGASQRDLQLAYDSTVTSPKDAFQSGIRVETANYIRITSVETRDASGPEVNFSPGQPVTVEARVADPLGSYDIVDTGTVLDVFDPASTVIVSSVTMALASTDPDRPAGWKTFSHTFTLAATANVGTYTVKVRATEGNLVTTTGQTSLRIRAGSLTAGMAVSAASAEPATPLQYTIFLNNSADEDLAVVWVNATLPAEVAYVGDDGPAIGGQRTGNGTWAFVNLTPGKHQFRINVSFHPWVEATTVVVTRVDGAYEDVGGEIKTLTTLSVSTVVDGPRIGVAKVASPFVVDRGEAINYTVYINNTGNDEAPWVWVNDTLPLGVSHVSDTSGSLPSLQSSWWYGSTLHLNLTNVSVGSQQFSLSVVTAANLTGGVALVNTATLAYVNAANVVLPSPSAQATSHILGPNLSLNLTLSPDGTDPGSRVSLRLSYSNQGPGATEAYNVVIVVSLGPHLNIEDASAGLSFDPSRNGLVWSAAVIFANASGSLLANATLRTGTPDGTLVVVEANASLEDDLGNPLPWVVHSSSFLTRAPAIVPVLIPDRGAIPSGDIFNYTLFFNNSGTGRSRDVWINASLDPRTAILTVSVNVLGEVEVVVPRLGNRVAMHFQDLGPGTYEAVLQVELRAGLADGLNVTNVVTLEHLDANGNQLPSSEVNATVTVHAPSLRLTLLQDTDSVAPGSSVVVWFRIEGGGNATALEAILRVILPKELILMAHEADGAWTESDGAQMWTFSNVSPGEVVEVRLDLLVLSDAKGGLVLPLSGTLTFTDSFGLSREDRNSNVVTLTIVPQPEGFPWAYLLILLPSLPIIPYFLLRMPRVEEAFVIYRDGLLLAHRTRSRISDKEEEALAAMLTAVQEFIRDSLSRDTSRELHGLNLGDRSLQVERGQHLYLAIVHSGKPTPGLWRTMRNLVARLEAEYRPHLEKWQGIMEPLAPIAEELEVFFRK